MRGFIEVRGTGQKIVEYRHGGGVVFIGASADHGILHAELDRFITETDRLAAGGAGGGRGNYPAGDFKHLGNVDRGGVDHGFEVIHCADGGEPVFRAAEEILVISR